MERYLSELSEWAGPQNGAAPCHALYHLWMWSPGFMESCTNSGSTSACVARMQNVSTTVRQNRRLLQARERRRTLSDMAPR